MYLGRQTYGIHGAVSLPFPTDHDHMVCSGSVRVHGFTTRIQLYLKASFRSSTVFGPSGVEQSLPQ